ncbi:MAG: hypothetical protein WD896_02180 [Parcubacteria group bacterium]
MTAFGRWFAKWFWTYRYWTWPPLLVVAIIIWWLTYTVATSGDAIRFISFFLLSVIGITAYYWVRGELPPIWITVTALVVPLFLWGFWLIRPEWYIEWRASGYFLWMILATAVFGWLAGHKTSSIANIARIGLLLLMITAICVGAYGKWEEKKKAEEVRERADREADDFSHLDTIFMKVAREGKPAWVVIPQGWHIEWKEDDDLFSSQAVWQGGNKVRIFITKPGVKLVEIPIRRWYEPAKRRR